MTLDKAIEIKQHYQYILQDASLPELIEADNISIEALKRVKIGRGQGYDPYFDSLPGETEPYCKFCGQSHAGIECPSREGEK